MSETVRDCLIVGGGVSGCTAAIYAKRYSLDVLVLDTLGGGGGATATASLVENYPGFPGGITGLELAQRVHQQATEVGAEFGAKTVERIEPSGESDGAMPLWRVTAGDESVLTRTVILTMGAFPRSLMVPGEVELRGQGVSYCATCDGFFYRGKTVAVVGGGNAAVDEALYLANLAGQVYLIHRRDQLRAESYMQDKILSHDKVQIIWDTVVKQVLGDSEVTGLQLENVKTGALSELPVDGLFVAIGHIAKTEWLAGLLDMEEGFIRTDEMMRTNQPGIFAAGDIRVTPLRQISTAVGDATMAAYSAYQYVAHEGR
jgi:thioredoxin reductase (NADPH)